jgi:hypothetical protein
MRFSRIIFLACLFACFSFLSLNAQDVNPVQFSYAKERTTADEVLLTIKAAVKPGIKLYAVQQIDSNGIGSSIAFDKVLQNT